MGTQLPPKKVVEPQFSAHVYCGQTAGWIKMPLGTKVGLGPGDVVLDGDPAPPPPKVHSPQFLAHSCCSQMAGWINMPLGREVGLDQSNIVLDGNPAPPPQKGAQPPIFGPCLLWPNGWMDQDASWDEGRPRPGQHYVRCEPSSTPTGDSPLPNFRRMCIVAKRLDGSRCHLVRK